MSLTPNEGSNKSMYEQGQVLKSKLRATEFPLFVMVCDDGSVGGSLDQTDRQFRAVVLMDLSEISDDNPGRVENTWNKGRWILSSLIEVSEALARSGLEVPILIEPIKAPDLTLLKKACDSWLSKCYRTGQDDRDIRHIIFEIVMTTLYGEGFGQFIAEYLMDPGGSGLEGYLDEYYNEYYKKRQDREP